MLPRVLQMFCEPAPSPSSIHHLEKPIVCTQAPWTDTFTGKLSNGLHDLPLVRFSNVIAQFFFAYPKNGGETTLPAELLEAKGTVVFPVLWTACSEASIPSRAEYSVQSCVPPGNSLHMAWHCLGVASPAPPPKPVRPLY